MKHTLISFLIFFLSFYANAQYTAIPDSNFEIALSAYDDIFGDNQVPTSNISTLTSLSLFNSEISDLTGIQDFLALESLNCSGNSLLNLDTSFNTNLMALDCSYNNINSLNVSTNSGLKNLICNNNSLSSLNISNNLALEKLYCNNNNISTLVITSNPNLIELSCNVNPINSINLSQSTNLEVLSIGSNSLTILDLSSLTSLEELTVSEAINILNIDVTNNLALSKLIIRNTGISSINTTLNSNLTTLSLYDTSISTVDLSQNLLLEKLNGRNAGLTTIDISNNTNLDSVVLDYNSLNALDVSQNPLLQTLWVNNNNLTTINVTQNPVIKSLNLSSSLLTGTLDLSQNPNIRTLRLQSNSINYLNLKSGGNTNLIGTYNTTDNPNLTCIEVDDVNYAITNFTNTDPVSTFVNNQSDCQTLNVSGFNKNNFAVHPNPVKDILTINTEKNVEFNIISIQGKVIKTGELNKGYNTINIESFSKGLYFLKFKPEKNMKAFKIIKQ